MNPLTHPDDFHLQAAEGWFELGNIQEAGQELEKLTPEACTHPEVLEIRFSILSHGKQWEACVEVADSIIKLLPANPFGWIHRSYALHELKRTQEALDQLSPIVGTFPEIWTIPYNLACYCAQLDRLSEGREWFKKAMVIDKTSVQQAAKDDPDLLPLELTKDE